MNECSSRTRFILATQQARAHTARMTTSPLQQVEALLAPLLRTLEALGHIARHLHPVGYTHQLAVAGALDAELREASKAVPWPDPYSALRPPIDEAVTHALATFDGLREAAAPPEDLTRAFRALRHAPRALEALYPLAGILPPVSRFFLDSAHRADAGLQRRLMKQPPPANTGVICLGEDPDARTSVWVYAPESYDPTTPAPVVFALHGGSGRGRAFLWSWVSAARSRGAIVVAPTSIGQTWAIQGEDRDTPRLARLLAIVRETWTVDPSRILLAGMSDGGTFTYTSGLDGESPFTHLAPVAAAFHPMLVAMADGQRLRGLPVHIIHGARDWMFPSQMADEAAQYLAARGANVAYRRLDDLSHSFGGDLSAMILDWVLA